MCTEELTNLKNAVPEFYRIIAHLYCEATKCRGEKYAKNIMKIFDLIYELMTELGKVELLIKSEEAESNNGLSNS